MNKKELMLYIHIPFCVSKCAYCDFLSAAAEEGMINSYVDALCNQIISMRTIWEDKVITSIFIGGGTPSILTTEQMEKLLIALKDSVLIAQSTRNIEFTIECNPGTITFEKVELYKKYGVNRLSLGLQSANNKELMRLGRIHTFEEFLESYSLARKAGFENINIDLMSALPEQTVESYLDTLKKVIDLKPEHISAYSLILEEGTKFFDIYGEGKIYENMIPTEEMDRIMYHETKHMLQTYGYDRYEISNYAKPGYACKHNLGYWKRKEYLGLGLGASSFYEKKRFHIIEDINKYQTFFHAQNHKCEKYQYLNSEVFCEVQELTKREEMEEFMFLGLRVTDGISKKDFYNQYLTTIESIYGNIIQKLIKKELMEDQQDTLKLTELGLDVCNQVFSEFLL